MAKFNKDSVGGTLTIVVLLSLVCSLIVAGAAVLLKPTQEIQKQLDKQKNILQAAGLMQENTNVQDTYAKFIEPKIVDLSPTLMQKQQQKILHKTCKLPKQMTKQTLKCVQNMLKFIL